MDQEENATDKTTTSTGINGRFVLCRNQAKNEEKIYTKPMAAMMQTVGIQESMYLIHLPPTSEKGTSQNRNMKRTKKGPASRRRRQISTRPTESAARMGSGVLIARNKG